MIFLRNFSLQYLFTLRVFARNLLRGNRRRNTFRFDVWAGANLFTSRVFARFLLRRIREFFFINYNTITNYIVIKNELRNLDHVLGVVSQTTVSGGNQTHDPHSNSLAHYPLDYQGTQIFFQISFFWKCLDCVLNRGLTYNDPIHCLLNCGVLPNRYSCKQWLF